MNTIIGHVLWDASFLLQQEPFTYFIGIGVLGCVLKIISGFMRPGRL